MTALLVLAASWAAVPVFSEIQAAPAAGVPEWVEISADAGTDFSAWSVDDGGEPRTFPPGTVVPPGGLLVASSGCATLRSAWSGAAIPCVEPAGWPRLSASADRIVLRNREGMMVDSVAWDAKNWGDWPAGRSIERLELGARPCDPSNWVPSTAPGGTPGWIPARIAPGIGALSLRSDSRAVCPGKANILRVAAPRDKELRVELCDLRRRVLAVVWKAAPPPEGRIEWDARRDGRNLTPGVYVLRAQSGEESARIWIAVGAP